MSHIPVNTTTGALQNANPEQLAAFVRIVERYDGEGHEHRVHHANFVTGRAVGLFSDSYSGFEIYSNEIENETQQFKCILVGGIDQDGDIST